MLPSFGVTSVVSLTLGRHVQHAERSRATHDLLRNDGEAVDISQESASPPQFGISQQLRSRPKQIFIEKQIRLINKINMLERSH